MSVTSRTMQAALRREPEVVAAGAGLPYTILRIAVGLMLVMVVGAGIYRLAPILDRPIRQLRVEGRLIHLTAAQVASAAAVSPGTRLFSLDLSAVQTRIRQLPWVAHVQIARRWPDALSISVTERRVFARWGEHSLLDTDAQVFTPRSTELSAPTLRRLPLLSGAPDQAAAVMAAWNTLSAALADGPLALAGLAEDARGEWSAQAASGTTLRLGVGDPKQKLEEIKNAVIPALRGNLAGVATIDLRYTNGFAVAAKTSTADGASGQPPEKESHES